MPRCWQRNPHIPKPCAHIYTQVLEPCNDVTQTCARIARYGAAIYARATLPAELIEYTSHWLRAHILCNTYGSPLRWLFGRCANVYTHVLEPSKSVPQAKYRVVSSGAARRKYTDGQFYITLTDVFLER